MDFATYVLVAYSTAGGQSAGNLAAGYWVESLSPLQASEEESQFYDAAAFFLENFPHKTFVFANCEGDWELRGGLGMGPRFDSGAAGRMARWLAARQAGITRARWQHRRPGAVGNVFHAAEVNLVAESLSGGSSNVVNEVLPQVQVDMVSYSSYDTQHDLNDFAAALRYIAGRHNRTPASPSGFKALLVGEFGLPQTRVPLQDVSYVLGNVINAALSLGVAYVLFWETYCNECHASAPGCDVAGRCRQAEMPVDNTSELNGFWLFRPDGSESWPAEYLRAKLNNAPREQEHHRMSQTDPEEDGDANFETRENALRSVRQDGMQLEWAPGTFANDRGVVWAAFLDDSVAIRFASAAVRNDREFMMRVVSRDGLALEWASEALRRDREVVLKAVEDNGLALEWAGGELACDREVVLKAVAQNGLALEWVGGEFTSDHEVVLKAVASNGLALQHAAETERDDQEVALMAVSKQGQALEFVGETLKNARGVVLTAVSNDGYALKFAGAALKNDRGVVMVAVSKAGEVLEFAGEAAQNDRGVVLVAVRGNGLALQWASRTVKKDMAVVLTAVAQGGPAALGFAPEALRNDRDLIQLAVARALQNRDSVLPALHLAGKKVRDDRDLLMFAVSHDGRSLQCAGETVRKDRQVVCKAISNDGLALQWASEELKNDRDVVLKAISQNGLALRWAGPGLQSDRDVVSEAVSYAECNFRPESALQWASQELRNDRDMVLQAVARNGRALEWASEGLKSDRRVVAAAVSKRPDALQWASDSLLQDETFAAEAKKRSFLIRITSLSGSSCVVALDDDWIYSHRWRRCVVEMCLARLGMDQHLAQGAGLFTLMRGCFDVVFPEFVLVIHMEWAGGAVSAPWATRRSWAKGRNLVGTNTKDPRHILQVDV
ncbi:unnamed protein product [Symbiodinium natans]|uniref:DUF4116 domain-containing protein n=1 Tax=Symbiodinium natans TaxID=878477 RepID=A0A812PYK4_9DINO|nr:unnamed protein product [Symbiodinium natans]